MEDILNSPKVLAVLKELDAARKEDGETVDDGQRNEREESRNSKKRKIAEQAEREPRTQIPETDRQSKVLAVSPDEDLHHSKLQSIALHLKHNVETCASMNLDDIVRLVDKGLQQGLQPKFSPATSGPKPAPYQCPKRTGPKRGAYKQKTKDGWTSCELKTSVTVPHNATESKRNPSLPFQARELVVRDVELSVDTDRAIKELNETAHALGTRFKNAGRVGPFLLLSFVADSPI